MTDMQAPKRSKPVGSGRRRGTPNKTTAELREIARTHTDEAIEVLIALMNSARNDMTRLRAAQELLDRGHGRAPREQAQAINLPRDVSLAVQGDAVMSAIISGAITIPQGHQMIDVLAGLAKIREACELESRLSALESRLGGDDAKH